MRHKGTLIHDVNGWLAQKIQLGRENDCVYNLACLWLHFPAMALASGQIILRDAWRVQMRNDLPRRYFRIVERPKRIGEQIRCLLHSLVLMNPLVGAFRVPSNAKPRATISSKLARWPREFAFGYKETISG